MKKELLKVSVALICFIGSGVYAQTDSLVYTHGIQKVVVPSCVDSITVDLAGAQGGSAYGGGGIGVPGGRGGRVQATIPVTAGDTLYVYVGGHGDSGNGVLTIVPGGFNGGGFGHKTSTVPAVSGGGGGGATDIRIGGTRLAHRVVVAGGGGGNGWNTATQMGGAGGGLSGANGNDLGGYYADGGTQASGGAGENSGGGNIGTPGDSARGGNSGVTAACSGGGGGGGYNGGGGGSKGGGGGGCGYTEATAVRVTQTSGYRAGNGYAVIRFTGGMLISIDSSISGSCNSKLWAVLNGGTAPYTYRWSPGGSTHDTLSNVCPGSYTVMVTDGNGCTDSTVIHLVITGVNQVINNADAKVYPVPASGTLNVELNNNEEIVKSFSIYDITGRLVMERSVSTNSNKLSIDISALDKGIYFMQLFNYSGLARNLKFEVAK
jgi:hypothetical protein